MTRLKESEKQNMSRLVGRLGSCRLQLRATDDHISATVRATLSPQSFESGDYIVHVGFRRCGLRLEHEGFDVEKKYSAVIGGEFWESKNKMTSEAKSGLEGEIGGAAKFMNFFKFGGKISRGSRQSDASTHEGKSVLPLIEATSEGWSIGSEAGDPRVADEAADDAMSGCLRGEYFSGREGEQPDVSWAKDAPTCVLRPRAERANVFQVTATLYGAAGGLVIAIARKDGGGSPGRRGSDDDRIAKFKECLIGISLQAAGADARAASLSGEVVLHEQKCGAPKVLSRAPKSE